ncbi:MAG TPA: AMP-binding protein [Pseudonocardiaceae bacterium]|jgi:long-chain acyl-CoA synthetase
MNGPVDAPWTDLYPDGVRADQVGGAETMLAAWDSTLARLGPDSPAVHYFDRTLSLGEVDASAEALAASLQDLGLRAGDHVAVYVQNDPHWLITMLAAWKCGGAAVAVNPMLRERELAFVLSDSGARFLVCLDELYPIYDHVRDQIDVEAVVITGPTNFGVRVKSSVPASWESADNVHYWYDLVTARWGTTAAHQPLTGDSVALLTYTSGTTGRAKGALNTHRGMVHSCRVYAAWFSLDEGDTVLGIAPLFHITGSVAGMGVTILTGAPLVLLHRFDAARTLQAIQARRTTFTVAAVTAFIAMLNCPDVDRYDLSSLTKVASGGAPVSQATVDRIRAATGWRVHGVYGLTETTSPTHLAPPDHPAPVDQRSGALSVGVPVPGARVRIVDVESGRPLAEGEEGEIVVSGPMVVPGYWAAPEESAHAIRDGWLFTGDIGVMTEPGWLFVVDRKKDLINAGGYKVWPREVEDVLYQHPAVREAAVVGVTDSYRGETVKAYVTLVPGASAAPAELIAFARERMAAYKYPRVVEILADLPKTASGKVLRRELRERQGRIS